MKLLWLHLSHTDLLTEREQCRDEGKEIGHLLPEFERLLAADLDEPENQRAAQALLDGCQLAACDDVHEPSDLESIRALRPESVYLPHNTLTEDQLRDKTHGGWVGRCCGCLLGKPVEGVRTDAMWPALKELNRWPLSGYFRQSDAPPEFRERYPFYNSEACADRVDAMPVDDDLNYTVTGRVIMEQHGPDFTPDDIARFWLANIPLMDLCTAERVAARNFLLGLAPPESAAFRNPYREWIGAQIRADYWGYCSPGQPERAAEFAWRDACISHVKNGIYGEMWAAAMIAAAFVSSSCSEVIEAGLAQIPADCRLALALREVLQWSADGLSYDDAVARIHTQWDEHNWHHWTHTIPNAMIVATALLWGEMDYGTTICRAVQPGFDTDCNGATAGSVLGVMLGRSALPDEWAGVINDTLRTSVAGYREVRLADLAY